MQLSNYRHEYLCGLLMVILMLLPHSLHAQKFEAGLYGGFSAYHGDLNTERIFHKVYPAAGLVLRINHNDRISTRANATWSVLRSSDRSTAQRFINIMDHPDYPAVYYEFETDIFELSIQGEYNILPLASGSASARFTPYLFAGVGGVYFSPNPMEFGNGGTDRQPTQAHQHPDDDGEYNNLALVGLTGLGFKYNFTQHLSGSIDVGLRVSTTDYLDEVSHKGDPSKNDGYSFAGFSLTYALGVPRGAQARCPY